MNTRYLGRLCVAMLSVWSISWMHPAVAAWQPTGPITIVVPSGPGGGNDRTARILAHLLQEEKLVSNPIVVVNKTGAGGVIAQNFLNAHEGDGTYVMLSNPTLLTNPIMGVGAAQYTDVTPLAQLFTEYVMTVARTQSPVKSGKQVLHDLKQDPDTYTIGVALGLGGAVHISIALVAKAAGIAPTKLRMVPYLAAGDAMAAMLGGHVDLLVTTPANVSAQLQAGLARGLAISAPKGLSGSLAQVPTWKEEGADVVFGNWRGLVGPAGMTSEQVDYWESTIKKLVDRDAWKKEVAAEQGEPMYMDHVQSAKFLAEDNVRLTEILKELGLAKQ